MSSNVNILAMVGAVVLHDWLVGAADARRRNVDMSVLVLSAMRRGVRNQSGERTAGGLRGY